MSLLALYGVPALTFMLVMYALEKRGPIYVAGFAVGCGMSRLYGFLAGTWPFGVVEAIWAIGRDPPLRRPPGSTPQSPCVTRHSVTGI